jgi:hypothetical protein
MPKEPHGPMNALAHRGRIGFVSRGKYRTQQRNDKQQRRNAHFVAPNACTTGKIKS